MQTQLLTGNTSPQSATVGGVNYSVAFTPASPGGVATVPTPIGMPWSIAAFATPSPRLAGGSKISGSAVNGLGVGLQTVRGDMPKGRRLLTGWSLVRIRPGEPNTINHLDEIS